MKKTFCESNKDETVHSGAIKHPCKVKNVISEILFIKHSETNYNKYAIFFVIPYWILEFNFFSDEWVWEIQRLKGKTKKKLANVVLTKAKLLWSETSNK